MLRRRVRPRGGPRPPLDRARPGAAAARPGPPDDDHDPAAPLRAEITALLRESGRLQTGAASGAEVSLAWISATAALLAADALGVADFVLETESWVPALRTLRDRAAAQVQADRRAAAPADTF